MFDEGCPSCGHAISGSTKFCRNCGMENPASAALALFALKYGGMFAVATVIYFIPLTLLKYVGNNKDFWDILISNATTYVSWIYQLFIWLVIAGIIYLYYNKENKKFEFIKFQKLNYIVLSSLFIIIISAYYVNYTPQNKYINTYIGRPVITKEPSNSDILYNQWLTLSYEEINCVTDKTEKIDKKYNTLRKLADDNIKLENNKQELICISKELYKACIHNKVYDISSWIDSHPGGEIIKKAIVTPILNIVLLYFSLKA